MKDFHILPEKLLSYDGRPGRDAGWVCDGKWTCDGKWVGSSRWIEVGGDSVVVLVFVTVFSEFVSVVYVWTIAKGGCYILQE